MEIVRKRVDRISISHNKPLFIVIVILIVLLGIIIYWILNNKNNPKNECMNDNECVASSCCHAESCVPKNKSPACDKVFCSQICSGPLDCGAGHCGCVKNKCDIIAD